MVQPFAQYLRADATLPREFFRPGVMIGFRDAVVDETFAPLELSKQIETFMRTHGQTRNLLAHTVRDPNPVETKPCFDDAIDLYKRLLRS
jgi:hypothetical protein